LILLEDVLVSVEVFIIFLLDNGKDFLLVLFFCLSHALSEGVEEVFVLISFKGELLLLFITVLELLDEVVEVELELLYETGFGLELL
jgi:hypothetical protein